MSSNENTTDLRIGQGSQKPDYTRAQEVSDLLNSIQELVQHFFSLADNDAAALAEGHGLQIRGGGPRTVLVEHHAPQKLSSLLNLSISPSEPGARDLVSAASEILKYSVNTSSPGFLDKLYSSPSPPGLAADLLLSCLNTNAHVYAVSPALTLVEKHCGRELAALFGLSDGGGSSSSSSQAGGVTVPGGAAANTTALLVARNVRFPGVKEDGVGSLPARLAVFVSKASHYSTATAAQTLGLGAKCVKKVRTRKGSDEMDVGALETAMEESVRNGEIPFFVCATAGTTVRGAYDDLLSIGRLARKYGAFFHVDACWGGGAVFSERLKSKLKGCELADTVAFNPHKMLGVPLTCSWLIARDMRMLLASNRLEAGYLFHGDSEDAQVDIVDKSRGQDGVSRGVKLQTEKNVDAINEDWRSSPWIAAEPKAETVYDLAQFVPQCGRRPDALKLYLHWRYYGTQGIARHVEASFAGAREVMRLVKESPVLKAAGDEDEPPCAQACFWYCGENGKLKMEKKVTREIVSRLMNRGFMTDYSPGEDKDEEYLRVVCNRLTTGSVAKGLVKAVEEVGRAVQNDLGL